MSWNMKKISAYTRRAGFIMIVVMSFNIVSGLRLFCADDFLASFRAHGIESVALAVTVPSTGSAEVSAGASANSDGKGGTVPCRCKKKKCPTIPRKFITLKPTHRLSEFQRQAKSQGCDSLVPQVTGHRFAARGDRPPMELGWSAPFFCSNPLALTSVLLI
jgi:hypothetical protein